MALPTGATAGPTKAATDKVSSGLRASALEAARAAALATHAAAGLALGCNRQAARALRAAEACSRTAVALLSAPPAPTPSARLPEDAAEEPPRRRRRRRGKRGGRRRAAEEGPAGAGHGPMADALALAPSEQAALPGPAAAAAAPMAVEEEEGAAPAPMEGLEEEGAGTAPAAAAAARHGPTAPGKRRGDLGAAQAPAPQSARALAGSSQAPATPLDGGHQGQLPPPARERSARAAAGAALHEAMKGNRAPAEGETAEEELSRLDRVAEAMAAYEARLGGGSAS